jgi:hypothetical protein
VQDELDRIKFEMLLHGVEQSEVDKISLDTGNEKIVSVNELRMLGIGGSGKRTFKKRVN